LKTSIPLYHQLKSEILKLLQAGTWAAETLIPSELELANQYKVSRTTVRQAIGDLVSMGYLTRQQGKGTFVTKQVRAISASVLYGFVEELRQRVSGEVVVQVHSVELQSPSEDIARHLELPLGYKVIVMKRSASVQHEVWFVETSYIVPPSLLNTTEALVHEKTNFDSVYGWLEQLGVRIAVGKQWIRSEIATEDDAHNLHVPCGSPILVVTRVTQDISGSPVEYAEVRYAAERYAFEVKLVRAGI